MEEKKFESDETNRPSGPARRETTVSTGTKTTCDTIQMLKIGQATSPMAQVSGSESTNCKDCRAGMARRAAKNETIGSGVPTSVSMHRVVASTKESEFR